MNDLDVARRVRIAEQAMARLGSTSADALSITKLWHHTARLANGDVVPGGKSRELLDDEFSMVFDPLPIAGQTVLDIGTWHGSFAFEAERRGASRVAAVDHYVWFNDDFKGLETFLFLHRDKSSSVEFTALDIENTTAERVGRFNVVLFLGVFYHLPDPLRCLQELSRIADPWLVLETHCDMLHDPLPAMRYYPGTELGGDGSNWWGPNPPCVTALLANAGFTDVRVTQNSKVPSRFVFHARKT